MDASMIYLETPRTTTSLNNVLIYDPSTAPRGLVTFDDIAGHLQQRLHLARAFRERLLRAPLDIDEPYWIEDGDFDLEYHLRHIGLPRPGNWRQLCTQVARLSARPLDMTRPLWELYFIEGLDDIKAIPPGCFVLLLRLHHASIDGVSGAEMLTAISDLAPDSEPPQPVTPWKPDPEPSSWWLLQRAAVHGLMRPVHMAGLAARTVPKLGGLRPRLRRSGIEHDLKPPGLTVPRTRFNGRVSAHRVVDARWFPLDTAKRMRGGAEAATINDVALTVVGGALRLYLSAKGELPDRSLVSLVPISIRTKEETGTGGNRVSMVRAPLCTDIADPVQRLAAITRITRHLKAQHQAVGARALAEISAQMPGRLMGTAQRATTRLALPAGITFGANTTVTNVPGSQQPLYFAGARLVRVFGAAPVLDGAGLIHVISSYCDEMVFMFTACRDMLPDPDFYAECIEDAFNDLSQATA
jgi:WS/DGAT/MGAT family acyltransferase